MKFKGESAEAEEEKRGRGIVLIGRGCNLVIWLFVCSRSFLEER